MPQTTNMPRLMTKAEAAAHCSITSAGFSLWVKKGIVPGPLPGTRRYDRAALDRALDKLSGISSAPEENPLEKWKREDAERRRLKALQPETRIDKIRRERSERARAKKAAKGAQGEMQCHRR